MNKTEENKEPEATKTTTDAERYASFHSTGKIWIIPRITPWNSWLDDCFKCLMCSERCGYSFEVSWCDGAAPWNGTNPHHYCSEMCTGCFLKLFPRDAARSIEEKNRLLSRCDINVVYKNE